MYTWTNSGRTAGKYSNITFCCQGNSVRFVAEATSPTHLYGMHPLESGLRDGHECVESGKDVREILYEDWVHHLSLPAGRV